MVTTNLSIPVNVEIKAESRDAYVESLKMILQHVADFHMTVVDIISEKYKIPVDEMMNAVTSDSRYANMLVDPKIHRLTSSSSSSSLNQDRIETETATAPTIKTAPITKKPTEKKIRIKPKNSVIVSCDNDCLTTVTK